jgi:hypothetical protein
MSFAGAKVLVEQNVQQKWVQIPDELKGSFAVPSIGQIFFAEVAVTAILMVIGFGLLTILYSLFYRTFGPSQYGPMDVPPR